MKRHGLAASISEDVLGFVEHAKGFPAIHTHLSPSCFSAEGWGQKLAFQRGWIMTVKAVGGRGGERWQLPTEAVFPTLFW